MIDVIIGRAGVGKSFECLSRARKILESESLAAEIIFLLPAYQTYRTELELAALTGGSFNTRMNSFNRFARQILDEVGGGLTPRISEIGRRLLLKKILLKRDRAGELGYYVRAAKQHGFAAVLSDELKELRTYSIDADKLSEAADAVDDAELRDKLRDLQLLTEDFKAALADKLTDDEDLLARATELLPQSPTIAGAEIFIDGFIFFDPQQRNFLRALIKSARRVHVTLPMDTDLNSRENRSEVGIFNRAFETFKLLRGFATELGVEFRITRLTEPRRFKSESLEILERRLFEYAPKKFATSSGLRIVEAVNRRAEIEFTAREILRLVKSGVRLREIGVLVRDETYFALIKPIFELHAIPHFVDMKRAAGHHPLAELIRSALEMLRGWQREAIFRCLRTGFFTAAAEDVDLLENYVIEFGLKGAATWQRTWDYRRAYSLDAPPKPADATELENLARINSTRKICAAPLIRFSERIRDAEREVTALTTALFNLLEELDVPAKLAQWSQTEEIRGNLALSREHLKIWDDVMNLLEQVVDALGGETLTRAEFESIIGEGLDALEMSLIPPGLDEVTVAQFDQNSLQNARAVFILGFDEKDFPRRVGEKNLLGDADRLRLNESGLEISMGGRERSLAEKFLIYRGLTEAREFMQLSYAAADSEGEKISASSLLNKIRDIFPNVQTERAELDVLQNLGSEIFTAGDKNLSADTAKKLYAPAKKMQGDITRFERFNQCPFKYFAQYGLDLRERVEYKVKTPDIGSILHAVMSNFGRQLQRENRPWSSMGESELVGRVDRILNDLTPRLHNKILLSTKTLEHRRERIKKVAVESLSRLIALDAASEFHPKIFEQRFYDYKTPGDVEINFKGQIDRIDLSGDGRYFLIIDYKTGQATLSLRKIYQGLSLQLAIYLGAAQKLSEVGGREAGAMLYCLLKIPSKSGRTDSEAATEAGNELKMPGLIRVDEEIKNAVDSTADFVDFNKKNLVSRADFQTVIAYAEKILASTAERILSGCIEVKPAKFSQDDDACKYCLFSAMCAFDMALNGTTAPVKLKDAELLAEMAAALQQ